VLSLSAIQHQNRLLELSQTECEVEGTTRPGRPNSKQYRTDAQFVVDVLYDAGMNGKKRVK